MIRRPPRVSPAPAYGDAVWGLGFVGTRLGFRGGSGKPARDGRQSDRQCIACAVLVGWGEATTMHFAFICFDTDSTLPFDVHGSGPVNGFVHARFWSWSLGTYFRGFWSCSPWGRILGGFSPAVHGAFSIIF